MGGLEIAPDGVSTSFTWAPVEAPEACFTIYKLVWSATSGEPSYLGEHDGALAIEGQATTAVSTDTIPTGTYAFRVQAIRITAVGKFIVAQTDPVEYAIP